MTRNTLKFLTMSALFAVLFVSCNKKEEKPIHILTAKINGLNYIANDISVEVRISDPSDLEISITGYKVKNPFFTGQMAIGLHKESQGTYQLSQNSYEGRITYIEDYSNRFHPSQSGQFTITEHDIEKRRIQGTFFATCVDHIGSDTLEITDGVVDIYY